MEQIARRGRAYDDSMPKDPKPSPSIEGTVEHQLQLEKSRQRAESSRQRREALRLTYEVVETRSPAAIPRSQRKV
jgi:hypothetical protein